MEVVDIYISQRALTSSTWGSMGLGLCVPLWNKTFTILFIALRVANSMMRVASSGSLNPYDTKSIHGRTNKYMVLALDFEASFAIAF